MIDSTDAREGRRSTFGTLDALQALRAAAALLVVFDHALRAGGVRSGPLLALAQQTGLVGVCVFFVISGLVMMLGHGHDFAVPGATGRFLARRLGRIVPLYWLTILIAAPLFPAQLSLGTFAASLLFIPHHAPGMTFGIPLNPIGWTLQYELVFYLLFALALALPRRIGIALIAAILGLWVVAASRGLLGHDNALAYLGRPIILYFLAGMALGVVRERWRGNAAGPLGFAVSLGIAAAAMAAACALRFLPGLAPSSTTAILAAATVIAVSACAFSRNAAPGGRAQSVSRAVGDATYSIYLTHLLPLALLAVAIPAAASPVALAVFVPVASLVAVIFGLLIYRFVEKPLVQRAGLLSGQIAGIGGRRPAPSAG